MWLRDFHVDGLRLDAVHALVDDSPVHLLEELAIEVAALSSYVGRPLTLIAESDLNDPVMVTPREAGGYGLDAQWSDDFHHALHVALTGETERLLRRLRAARRRCTKVCERGFFHDGTWSSFRGRDHGAPIDTAAMPTWRLVVCHQNHDQVGNRARGDRTTEALDVDQLCAAALVTAGRAVHADAVHGRGVGRVDAVPVLHLPPRARARPAPRPRAGSASSRRWAGTRRSVPDPQDVARPSRGRSWTGPSSPRATTPTCSTPTASWPRCAARSRRSPTRRSRRSPAPPTRTTRVFTMRRRDLLVVVNFGTAEQRDRGRPVVRRGALPDSLRRHPHSRQARPPTPRRLPARPSEPIVEDEFVLWTPSRPRIRP